MTFFMIFCALPGRLNHAYETICNPMSPELETPVPKLSLKIILLAQDEIIIIQHEIHRSFCSFGHDGRYHRYSSCSSISRRRLGRTRRCRHKWTPARPRRQFATWQTSIKLIHMIWIYYRLSI